jgi:small-conductance mechanosensitive channel
MRALFLLLLLLFTQQLTADSNITEKVKNSILELMSTDNNEVAVDKNIVKSNNLKKEESNGSTKNNKQALEEKKKKALNERIDLLEKEKEAIDEELIKNNLWASVYFNHETYQRLDLQLQELNDELKLYKSKSFLTKEEQEEFDKKTKKYKVIEGKLNQLKEYKEDPFIDLYTAPKIMKEPTVTNPLDIITAMSFKKQLDSLQQEYLSRYQVLEDAIYKLKKKSKILQELVVKTKGNEYKKYVEELRATENKITDFGETLEIFKTASKAFNQEVSQVNTNIDDSIDAEIEKSIVTGAIILFLLLFFFFIKYLVKKYMSDNELFYGTNKVINFLFIFLVFTILLFTYLENVGHLITVLSFASAGIAIALKDWFMSLMGWFVILVSGSIHVGDRVKFTKDGAEYVGDVVDISVLRMTIHEDVTLTTATVNRRAGRIIFIPNHYVFTDMIANYSHSGLKTVWDGIDFLITFDSNVAKAQLIAKDVTRKYSKGYTDMTRKQLNRLRSKYSMRNTAVEPRIFGFMDTYGVRISAWYLTNAYATLTLRSTISMEILARLNEEDDIFIAYPSQSLYMNRSAPKLKLEEGEEPTENHQVEPMVVKPKSFKPNGWGAY